MSPLATSAVSTADGPGSTVTGRPASSAASISRAPGSLTPGRPASETSANRSPRLEPGQQRRCARRLVVAVVALEPRLDPVPLEQAARVARVLAEDELGLGELAQHAQGHVLEVADRRRADRERHRLARPSASNPSRPAPIRPPRSRARRARSAPRARRAPPSRGGRSRVAEGAMNSNAAIPKPPPTITSSGANVFTHEPIAAPSRCPIPESASSAADSPAARRGAPRSRPRPRASRRRGRRRSRTRPPRRGRGRCSFPGRGPVGDDDDMAELGDPAVERAPEDEAAADTGAEREHDRSSTPRPAPSFHSASAATLPSFSTTAGRPKRSWTGRRARRPGAGC